MTAPITFVSEMIPTNLVEGVAPVRLQLLVARPEGAGPFPTLVFNHGSTGTARSPAMFRRAVKHDALADYFLRRGWMVIFPQRRGRGKSDGLYDEGLAPGRVGYSCDARVALSGAERALDDVAAVMDHVDLRADVLKGKTIIGGASRGGALAMAYASRNPDSVVGVVNFNGGWLGQGCVGYERINPELFRDAARFQGPTTWLYGTKDNYYPIAHCRGIFDDFISKGGRGDFHAVRGGGHMLVLRPEFWRSALDQLHAHL
ncbi:alpha/beta hydrolase family protein [Ramlibacter sp.]|uniref:alpha/beta hydrolase family protein n=1 Tax=Ramlibacter sp. TaxID=1917967 RepID=UPI003D0AF2C2